MVSKHHAEEKDPGSQRRSQRGVQQLREEGHRQLRAHGPGGEIPDPLAQGPILWNLLAINYDIKNYEQKLLLGLRYLSANFKSIGSISLVRDVNIKSVFIFYFIPL